MRNKKKTISEILDKANLHIHKRPLSHEEIIKLGETEDKDVPEYAFEDSKRIRDIVNERAPEGEEMRLTVGLAYDLWCLHSERAFCSSFTNIKGVSDHIIALSLDSLMQCAGEGAKLLQDK